MKNRYVYIVLVIIIILAWEILCGKSNNLRLLFSSPSLIWNYTIENRNSLLKAFGFTFLESTLGLIFSIILSFLIITICLFYQKMLDFLMPIMLLSQVIPLIVLAPLFIILMGSGISSKIIMATIISFFPIFVNFALGIRLIDKNLLDLMKVYNASKIKIIKHVYYPLSVPNIISGIKIAAPLSVIGAIVAEFSGATYGLGKNLFISALNLEPELMMASLFLSMFIGISLYLIIIIIEKVIGKWYLGTK